MAELAFTLKNTEGKTEVARLIEFPTRDQSRSTVVNIVKKLHY